MNGNSQGHLYSKQKQISHTELWNSQLTKAAYQNKGKCGKSKRKKKECNGKFLDINSNDFPPAFFFLSLKPHFPVLGLSGFLSNSSNNLKENLGRTWRP